MSEEKEKKVSEGNKDKKIWILVVLLVLIFLSLGLWFLFTYDNGEEDFENIQSFQQCVDAGYDVIEIYPEQCIVPDGRIFVREVEDDDRFIDDDGDDDFINIDDPDTEFYGSSTNHPCEVDEDCFVSGCNGEICQSVEEESMASICLFPETPLPPDLGYSCGCFDGECQWGKE